MHLVGFHYKNGKCFVYWEPCSEFLYNVSMNFRLHTVDYAYGDEAG